MTAEEDRQRRLVSVGSKAEHDEAGGVSSSKPTIHIWRGSPSIGSQTDHPPHIIRVGFPISSIIYHLLWTSGNTSALHFASSNHWSFLGGQVAFRMSNATYDYGDLTVTMTSSYDWVWDDEGSGARRSVAVWAPKPQGNLYPVGQFASPRGTNPNGKRASILVGQNPNTHPAKAAVARPREYIFVSDDKGSGGKNDGSFWRPVPPSGYVAIGDVAVKSYNMPNKSDIWCVREDLASQGKYLGSSIWDDGGSGAARDTSLWSIQPASTGIHGSPNIPVSGDTFRVQSNPNRPGANTAQILVLPVGKLYHRFNTPTPTVTPDTIPSVGDQYGYKEQCKVTLPFHSFFAPTDQACLDNIRNPFYSLSRGAAWYVEGAWENNKASTITQTKRLLCGLSKEKREELIRTVGVEVSDTHGVALANGNISLNYQFTHDPWSSFTEYSEREDTEEIKVPGHHAKVLYSKHVWIKGAGSNESDKPIQVEIVANNAVAYGGCTLPHY